MTLQDRIVAGMDAAAGAMVAEALDRLTLRDAHNLDGAE